MKIKKKKKGGGRDGKSKHREKKRKLETSRDPKRREGKEIEQGRKEKVDTLFLFALRKVVGWNHIGNLIQGSEQVKEGGEEKREEVTKRRGEMKESYLESIQSLLPLRSQ